MSKRNQVIVMSPEAEALKKLRLKSELSLRKLSEKLNMSFTRVHQMESGRENISEAYLEKFLKALGLNWDDWNSCFEKKDKYSDLRRKCHEILDAIEPSKLELIHELITRL